MFRVGLQRLAVPVGMVCVSGRGRGASTVARMRKAAKDGNVEEAALLFGVLSEVGTPEASAWDSLIKAHLTVFDLQGAMGVVDAMFKELPGESIKAKTLEGVMKAMGEAGSMDGMAELLDRAQAAQVEPLPIGPLLQAHIKTANIDAAADMLCDLHSDPDATTPVTHGWVRSVMDGYFGIGSVDGVKSMAALLDTLAQASGKPHQQATQSMLKGKLKSANPAMRNLAKDLMADWFPAEAEEDAAQ